MGLELRGGIGNVPRNADGERALRRRTLGDPVVPAIDGGELVVAHGELLVLAGPAEDREVGDRQAGAGHEVDAARALALELALEHAIQAPRLVDEALDGVRIGLAPLGDEEMLGLAKERTEATDLPEQPFVDLDPL